MVEGWYKINANGLAPGELADYEALNCRIIIEFKNKKNTSFNH